MIMSAIKPDLLRAFYTCITRCQCTPILVIDAQHPHCQSLQEYETDGEVVFNISPSAVRDLFLSNDSIEFRASFLGVISFISIPIDAVLAIYAEETDEGMFFNADKIMERHAPGLYLDIEKNLESEPMSKFSKQDTSSYVRKSKKKPDLRIVE